MFAEAGYPVTAGGEMSDELVETLAVSGGPEEIRDRLEAIRASGIDELMISHLVVADEEPELAALSEILAGE
jgi:alkanesulfonate monooxygenase SsuD/methylene tetrahydromethanopterin reductase-like flavin-dependent oxidoreductase (luciferase family)